MFRFSSIYTGEKKMSFIVFISCSGCRFFDVILSDFTNKPDGSLNEVEPFLKKLLLYMVSNVCTPYSAFCHSYLFRFIRRSLVNSVYTRRVSSIFWFYFIAVCFLAAFIGVPAKMILHLCLTLTGLASEITSASFSSLIPSLSFFLACQ